ncbi:hypothetical protein MNBD_GAMMA24-1464 [hydrothermal vent metagenome]|uniref:Uncharacterized protein n=1 Tax=hydrothermal vent metagenome TaxID=652676 RepID=A0A3B1BHP7_9ZZZZ
MSKGKEHKRYEFGTKASVAKTRDSNILMAAAAFNFKKWMREVCFWLANIGRIFPWVIESNGTMATQLVNMGFSGSTK